ncbi:hypothetical protein AUR64_17215 [Haloprofundus marisrubri]|uniref:Uncharacterized protein n=1 Tax=Haloprofundus marisrubri TaxID=1514971 RepID=A0A0W1R926_9EURY|nr:hypothetical protein [Haloprofundus marisrubri]KTG09508.1 hypothetical protein AUR64_17215 [Haloprofundus marisrubri]
MPWYAIDAIDDAIDSTRRFLFPFSLGRWLRLAVIVFFLGALSTGGSPPTFGGGGDVPTQPQPTPSPSPAPDIDPGTAGQLFLLIAGLVVFIIALSLLFGLIGDVMRFVFLDALRTDDVRIRTPFRRRFGKGARLFLFKFILTLAVNIPIFAGIALFILAFAAPDALSGFGIDPGLVTGLGAIGLFAAIAVLAIVSIVLGLIVGLTNTFVTAVMLVDDTGVVEGWRRFWPTLRGEWKQYLVYLIMRAILGIGVGIVTGIVVAIPALVIGLITVVIVIAIGSVFGAMLSPATVILGGLTFLVAFLAFLLVALPVGIVAQTYFRMYELMVLGRSNPRFALISIPDDEDDDDENGDAGTDGDDGNDGPDGGFGTSDELGDDNRFGTDTDTDEFGTTDRVRDDDGTDSDDRFDSRSDAGSWQSTTDDTSSTGDSRVDDDGTGRDDDESGFRFGPDKR